MFKICRVACKPLVYKFALITVLWNPLLLRLTRCSISQIRWLWTHCWPLWDYNWMWMVPHFSRMLYHLCEACAITDHPATLKPNYHCKLFEKEKEWNYTPYFSILKHTFVLCGFNSIMLKFQILYLKLITSLPLSLYSLYSLPLIEPVAVKSGFPSWFMWYI